MVVSTAAAYDMILEVVRGMSEFLERHEVSVHVIKSSAPVAPLATTSLLAEDLKRCFEAIKDADLIIIPGLVEGAAADLEKTLGLPVIKGTVYAGDLPRLIELVVEGKVGIESLKGNDPADVVIGRVLRNEFGAILKMVGASNHLFKVKNSAFTLRPPPLNLFYELCANTVRVCPSPRLRGIKELAQDLKMLGYSGLIVGCDVKGCYEDLHKRLALINESGLISGIDAYNYAQLDPDTLAEADMLLNIDEVTLDSIASRVSSKTILTLIPSVAGSAADIINSLTSTVNKALEYGFKRILVDPILKPPMLGLFGSLKVLNNVAESINQPILAGLCNVYELIDADTSGVIALLTALLFEAGVGNLLVTEASRKACGAAEEASIARELVYWAYIRKSPPKDYVRNLLTLKDKRFRQPPTHNLGGAEVKNASIITVDGYIEPVMDEKYVKIHVVHRDLKLVVDVYRGHKLLARYVGSDPLSLGRVVVKNERLSADHSLYLGFELCKAYSAIKLLKEYIQDEELFSSPYILGKDALGKLKHSGEA